MWKPHGFQRPASSCNTQEGGEAWPGSPVSYVQGAAPATELAVFYILEVNSVRWRQSGWVLLPYTALYRLADRQLCAQGTGRGQQEAGGSHVLWEVFAV